MKFNSKTDFSQTDLLLEKSDKNELTKAEICELLALNQPEDIAKLKQKSQKILQKHLGNAVFLRALIEFSNYCACDCNYCGIRRSNRTVTRYQLTVQEVIDCVNLAKNNGFRAIVLQAGERCDKAFINYVLELLTAIKSIGKDEKLGNFGITLSVGEQSFETYKKFFDAGANRYLLRIETSNKSLFHQLHQSANSNNFQADSYERRKNCLSDLQMSGYQVGTGVMIGLPGQTVADLADDILFFRDKNIDMLGMGPYIPHQETPIGAAFTKNDEKFNEKFNKNNKQFNENNRTVLKNHYESEKILQLSLNMLAVARIVLKDVNIASTTALETLSPNGRILGLEYGANVVMPRFTPESQRNNYLLYENNSTNLAKNNNQTVENIAEYLKNFVLDCSQIGREVKLNESGDSLHFLARKNL